MLFGHSSHKRSECIQLYMRVFNFICTPCFCKVCCLFHIYIHLYTARFSLCTGTHENYFLCASSYKHFTFTKDHRRFLSKRNSLSWAFAWDKLDLNAKYMQNSSTHWYFHNGRRAWQVSERVYANVHVNPWQCSFKKVNKKNTLIWVKKPRKGLWINKG